MQGSRSSIDRWQFSIIFQTDNCEAMDGLEHSLHGAIVVSSTSVSFSLAFVACFFRFFAKIDGSASSMYISATLLSEPKNQGCGEDPSSQSARGLRLCLGKRWVGVGDPV